jgi:hypothetical protein
MTKPQTRLCLFIHDMLDLLHVAILIPLCYVRVSYLLARPTIYSPARRGQPKHDFSPDEMLKTAPLTFRRSRVWCNLG